MWYELWCRKKPGQFVFLEGFSNENTFNTLIDKYREEFDEFIIVRKTDGNIICGVAFYYEKPEYGKTLIKKEGRV